MCLWANCVSHFQERTSVQQPQRLLKFSSSSCLNQKGSTWSPVICPPPACGYLPMFVWKAYYFVHLHFSEVCRGMMVRRQLSTVGFVSQHSQRCVGEIPQDVHRLPLQQQRLLHKLVLALHQQLHRLSQHLQRLGHRGQKHPAGSLLLEAL